MPRVSIRSTTRSRVWLCFVMRCRSIATSRSIVTAPTQVVNTTVVFRSGPVLHCAAMAPPPVTEGRVPGYADLDLRSTLELVRLVNAEDARVPAAVARLLRRSQRPSTRSSSGCARGRLIYVGAGTSGRWRVVDAAECGPTFKSPTHGRRRSSRAAAHRSRSPGSRRGRRGRGRRRHRAREVGPADAVVGALRRAAGRPTCSPPLAAAREAGALTVASCAPTARRSARGRAPGRRRRRPRDHHRLHPHEGGDGAEADPQHDLERRDDPARPDLREPHGRRRPEQRKLAPAPAVPSRSRPTRPTRPSTLRSPQRTAT